MITDINQLDKNGHYTYADYLTWQFTEMVEIIKGKLFMMSPAPLRYHQQIVTNLAGELIPYFKSNKCNLYFAPFDVRLVKNKATDKEVTTVVQPDFCVICDATKLDDRGCVGAPDFIVEILSDSTAKKDFNEKYNIYEENGVQEYWIVNPNAKTVYQYYLSDEGNYIEKGIYYHTQQITAHIFPELTVALKEIF